MFNIRNIGKTLVRRTRGTKNISGGLQGHVFEASLADLQNDDVAFRKLKLITEDVLVKNYLTNLHGTDLTCDKMSSMVKKRQLTSVSKLQMVICFIYSVLILLKKMQQSDSEDLLCSALLDPPNPEEDGNHDPRGIDT